MRIYLKKKLIAVAAVGVVLFVGTFIMIMTVANKNKNYAVEETIDNFLNTKDDHMNMFNDGDDINNNVDVEVDNIVDGNEMPDEEENHHHSKGKGYTINVNDNYIEDANEVPYDEEAEERESQLLHCNENLRLLNEKLNNTLQENTKKEELMESFAYKYLSTDIVFNNFMDLRDRAELHTMLWRKIYGDGPYTAATPDINDVILNPSSLTGDKKLLAILHKKLYPWLYVKFKSPAGLLRSYKGRGIVICTGSFHFRFARSTVDTLRNVIKTKLPIEIMYVGLSDLSEEHRKELESYENVFCTDVTEFFDNDIIFLSGFAVKPFAALASRFEEIILMDADATYIHDPAEWFEDIEYKRTGTLFFKDRTLYPGPHRGSEWIHEWMVEPSDYAKNTRFYKELSAHEMESSTVVINKSKRFLGMLLTCKFNEQKIRDRVVYQNVFGDKETYWMAFDMAKEPYSFIPQPIIYVGEINYGEDIEDKNQKQLCGHIGHTDRSGRIMFWNDHIIKDKHEPKYSNQLLRFEGWFYEDLENVQWTDTFHCANIKDDFPINEFTEEEKVIIKSILDRELEKNFVLNAGTAY